MAKENKKIAGDKFINWEQEVRDSYPKKEYSGIFESLLHAQMTLKYMVSEEGKAALMEELGEMVYLEQVRKQERAIKLREIELKVVRETLK